MIIVDASVLANAFMDDDELGEACRRERATDGGWLAPQHFWLELLSALRGMAPGEVSIGMRTQEAVANLPGCDVGLVDTLPFADRIWELREKVTTYDAAYVAEAEAYQSPLLTADRRLARASGPRCAFVLVYGTSVRAARYDQPWPTRPSRRSRCRRRR